MHGSIFKTIQAISADWCLPRQQDRGMKAHLLSDFLSIPLYQQVLKPVFGRYYAKRKPGSVKKSNSRRLANYDERALPKAR